MPGSTPATSQLDWLSSTTAMIVLSWSKATRDLLKSLSWGIRALHQSVTCSDDGATSFAACPIPSLRWREPDSNHRSPVTQPIFQCRLWLVPRQPKSRSEREPTHEASGPSPAEAMVRILFPPAASLVRTSTFLWTEP